ncbi:MAG: sugar kinase [Anaerolineae bacterium]|nr:sugar kinase [Anaerolineae bacterium]
MPRFDVTTFGEAMLRLSVPAGTRLEMAQQLDLYPAGAEANVAAALARLGHAVGWVSALPDHALGRRVAHALHQAGVDMAAVQWGPGRMGSYFVEFAVPPRPTQVIYDRADSCITRLQPADMPWDYLLDSRLLHLTGITPPLAPGCRAIVAEAIRRARGQGGAVSFDVNYRSKLWSVEDAAATLRPLIAEVDLLFCSGRDAQTLFGCSGSPEEAVAQLAAQTGARWGVMSLGAQGVIGWDGARIIRQAAAPVTIVDRIGAGDGLAAGVIYGWLKGELAAALRYGVMMAALALSQHGDAVITTREELEQLAAAAGGDVVR